MNQKLANIFLIILLFACRSARDECEYINNRNSYSENTCLLVSILYLDVKLTGESSVLGSEYASTETLTSRFIFDCLVSLKKAEDCQRKSKYLLDTQ